jgi:tyrosinase
MSFTRRTLVQVVATAGTAAAFSGAIPGLRVAAQAIVPARRSVGELALDDPILETYREFVAKMKEKDPSELVSWVGFADVHGTAAGFNHCPHGNWYFLPWHRAYLVMYERMCRELTGNQDFALPYWDWTIDRQLPAAFAEETWNGSPNPLFEPSRWFDPNDSLPDDMVGEVEVIEPVLNETNFELFGTTRPSGQDSLDQSWITTGSGIQGELEGNPHNRVHCWIGGIMCDARSPRDPIFMLHHGNIDRLWAVWNARGHQNSTDPLWADMEFLDHFIAPDGTLYSQTVSDLYEVEPLGYSYGLKYGPVVAYDEAQEERIAQILTGAMPAAGAARLPLVVSATNERAAQALHPLGITLDMDASLLAHAAAPRPTRGTGAEEIMSFLSAPEGAPRVLAFIRNLSPPEQSNTEVRVFINCDYLSQEVPTSDPHYVSTIGFFMGQADHAGHGGGQRANPSFTVDLTGALRRLARAKRLSGEDITVQLLPVPRPGVPLGETGTVTPAEVEVVIV